MRTYYSLSLLQIGSYAPHSQHGEGQAHRIVKQKGRYLSGHRGMYHTPADCISFESVCSNFYINREIDE